MLNDWPLRALAAQCVKRRETESNFGLLAIVMNDGRYKIFFFWWRKVSFDMPSASLGSKHFSSKIVDVLMENLNKSQITPIKELSDIQSIFR